MVRRTNPVIVELYDRVIADSCSVGKNLDHRICPGGTLCLAWMCAGLPTSQTKAVGSGRRAAKIKEIGCIRVDAWRRIRPASVTQRVTQRVTQHLSDLTGIARPPKNFSPKRRKFGMEANIENCFPRTSSDTSA